MKKKTELIPLQVRLTKDVHKSLKAWCEKDRRSLNATITIAIEEFLFAVATGKTK